MKSIYDLATEETALDAVNFAVTNAVVSLHEKKGIAAEKVFEGAVNGAAAALIMSGKTCSDVAGLLMAFAAGFQKLEQAQQIQ